MTDYYEVCWKNYKNDTAGLGLQEHRATLRSECMEWILNHYHDDTLLVSDKKSSSGPRTYARAHTPLLSSDPINRALYPPLPSVVRLSFLCKIGLSV